MTTHRLLSRLSISRLALAAGLAVGLSAARPALAQFDQPDDEELSALMWQLALLSPDELQDLMDQFDAQQVAQQDDANVPGAQRPALAPAASRFDAFGRRVQADEPTVLAFKNVTVDQVVPFILEATGKVVFPMPDVQSIRITLLNDEKIPRSKALDMVFLALMQNGVAVIENKDRITLRSITEIDRADLPVIGPDESVRGLPPGIFVEKVFALQHASAANVAEMFKASVPTYARMTFDADSNQIVVMGDVALLQRFESRIEALDIAATAALATETFHLKFADATDIAQNIRDLYSPTQGQNRNQNQNPIAQFFQRQGQGGGRGGQGGQGTQGGQRTGSAADASVSQNLRVTANTQQNAVTVVAEKPVLDQIRRQIRGEWDIEAVRIAPRIYELKNTDPVKMKDILVNMFGSPGSRQGGQQQQQTATANRLYGQFTFEAIPEAGRLVVIAKNQANLDAIDEIIVQLDKPQTAGLPQIIELKHADAEQLAEQLNALLSRDGTIAQVTKAQTGLSSSGTSVSPFATQATQTNNQQTQQQQQNQILPFWWSRSQPSTTTAGSGNLVGKIRIVPVWRQNALMIMSPPEYQGALKDLVSTLDNPGRQVLLSAVIAEINIEDATALGLRWSNSAITPTNQDNAIAFGPSTAGTTAGGVVTGVKNDLLPGLFDTSVLNLGVDLNVLFQALNEKTAVNILSEPRIFTSDNQEAEFFAGQDIPFITESQPNDNGFLTQSFDYRAVGIALRVRPRITVNRDVDININLELSSIVPGQTLFGGFIVDRRETTTHLIIKDGQTVVISGILRTEDSDTKRKVPLLGDLPLIGPVFQSVERSKKKTELIAFVTPYVVGSEREVSEVDEADKIRLGEVRKHLQPIADMDRAKEKDKRDGPAHGPQPANDPQ